MIDIKDNNWQEIDLINEGILDQNSEAYEIDEVESVFWSEEEATAFWNVKGSDLFINPMTDNGVIPSPMYMKDSLGEFLFTPGMIHCVYGLPGSRKSLLLQTAVLEHSGVYLDLETSPIACKRRIEKLNYPSVRSSQFAFPSSSEEIRLLVKNIIGFKPTLVVFDSFGRLCNILNLDPQNDQDVGRIFQEILKPLSDVGHAVVFADHQPKKGTNRDFPFGSQNKKSQSDVLLLLEAKGQSDSSISLMKDRHFIFGERQIFVGNEFGLVYINPEDKKTVVMRFTDGVNAEAEKRIRAHKARLDNVMRFIEKQGPTTRSATKSAVGGNSALFKAAIDELLESGYLINVKSRLDASRTKVLLSISDKSWIFADGSHTND